MSYLKRLRGLGEVRLLIELKKFDLALLEIEKLMTDFPDDAELWYFRAEIYFDSGKLSLSESAIDESIRLDPNSSVYFNLKGGIYLAKSNYSKAIKCFEQGLSINPNEATCYSNLSKAYIEKRKYNKAIECSEKALSLSPDDEYSFNNLFWAYTLKGQNVKANSILQENLARNPENPDTVSNLGYQLYNKGDYKKSEEVFRSILAQYPEDGNAERGLSMACSANNGLMDLFNKKWFEQFLKVMFIGTFFLVRNIIRFTESSFTLLLIIPVIMAAIFSLYSFGMAIGKLLSYIRRKQFRSQFTLEELLFSAISVLLYKSGFISIIFLVKEAYETNEISTNSFLVSFYFLLLTITFSVRLDWNSNSNLLNVLLLTACLVSVILSILLVSFWWVAFVSSLILITLDILVSKGVVLRSVT